MVPGGASVAGRRRCDGGYGGPSGAAPLEQMKGQIAIGSFAAKNLFSSQGAGIFSALMALSLEEIVFFALLGWLLGMWAFLRRRL